MDKMWHNSNHLVSLAHKVWAFDYPFIAILNSLQKKMFNSQNFFLFLIFPLTLLIPSALGDLSQSGFNASLPYLWPMPSDFTFGNSTLSVDPQLSLVAAGNAGNSEILKAAFDRYRGIIFKHASGVSMLDKLWGRRRTFVYDISELKIDVQSDSEEVSWMGEFFSSINWIFWADDYYHFLFPASSWCGWELYIVSIEEGCSFDYWGSYNRGRVLDIGKSRAVIMLEI